MSTLNRTRKLMRRIGDDINSPFTQDGTEEAIWVPFVGLMVVVIKTRKPDIVTGLYISGGNIKIQLKYDSTPYKMSELTPLTSDFEYTDSHEGDRQIDTPLPLHHPFD